jgi:hypothetical protein
LQNRRVEQVERPFDSRREKCDDWQERGASYDGTHQDCVKAHQTRLYPPPGDTHQPSKVSALRRSRRAGQAVAASRLRQERTSIGTCSRRVPSYQRSM